MKKIQSLILIACFTLCGCGIATHSVIGIPATEYSISGNADNKVEAVAVTTGMVAGHGAVTYALWGLCWQGAVAYLGVSGLYSCIRYAIEENR